MASAYRRQTSTKLKEFGRIIVILVNYSTLLSETGKANKNMEVGLQSIWKLPKLEGRSNRWKLWIQVSYSWIFTKINHVLNQKIIAHIPRNQYDVFFYVNDVIKVTMGWVIYSESFKCPPEELTSKEQRAVETKACRNGWWTHVPQNLWGHHWLLQCD